MPRFPDDMKQARAHDARQKVIREKRRAAEEAARAKDAAALEELRVAAATKMGVDPDNTAMFVCRRGR